MIYKEVSENFAPKFEIASCFIGYDDKILLLRRQDKKFQGGKWGLPAGKLEKDEEVKKAVLREVKEETNLDILEDKIYYFGKTFHRHGDADFIFHMFYTTLDSMPKVVINQYEHQEFSWKKPSEIVSMAKHEIVEDLDAVCKIFYKI